MQHDFSLEEQLTNGIAQFIEEIKTDLNILQINFKDINSENKTIVEIIGFNNLSFIFDSTEDIIKYKSEGFQHTLIGFSFEKRKNGFLYCLKTDGCEVMFESSNFPSIIKSN